MGGQEQAQEVEATIIDDELLDPQSYEGWLAGLEAKVDDALTDLGGEVGIIEGRENYQSYKRARTELRKVISAIDDERKERTAALQKILNRVRDDTNSVLSEAKMKDAEIKAALDDYDRRAYDLKLKDAEEFWVDLDPDMAVVVPFATVRDVYAEDGKWSNKGTNIQDIKDQLVEAAKRINEGIESIESFPYSDNEKAAIKADYLSTLDLGNALRRVAAEKERREKLAELERQREEYASWVAEMQAEQAAKQQTLEQATNNEQPQEQPERSRYCVFEVTVPAEHIAEFRDAMVALGWAHGKKVREEYK